MIDTFDKLDGATRGLQQALDDLQYTIDKRMEWVETIIRERNGLRRERDALRRFVGDLEYYSTRWDGVSPDVRQWLDDRLRKMEAECVI